MNVTRHLSSAAAMHIDRIKRHYLDLRLGGVTINPLLQAGNFTMIAFLLIEDRISFYLFAPLFFCALVVAFGFVGFLFRRIQLSTDEDLKYEKQIELNRTLFHIMQQQARISNALNIPIDKEFLTRLESIKKISHG